jgi:hypothetical protein
MLLILEPSQVTNLVRCQIFGKVDSFFGFLTKYFDTAKDGTRKWVISFGGHEVESM